MVQVRVLCALGQQDDETQQFTLWGPRLAEMQRIDHMKRVDMYDVAAAAGSGNSSPGGADEAKDSLRFTQYYEDSHKDALEQVLRPFLCPSLASISRKRIRTRTRGGPRLP